MGEGQHGFKMNWSTWTLCFKLKSLIASALDEDDCVLVASLDLSSAFDLLNIEGFFQESWIYPLT
jgi:hypothetical protein